jgi:ADP-ribose pyrophosphatase YjhB (NUDIX family)
VNGYYRSKANIERALGRSPSHIINYMSSKITGCGALFYTLDTQRFLLLHRTQSKQNQVWGLVGGTTTNENLWEGLQREIKEEIGDQNIIKRIPMETFISNDENFLYHTYICVVEKEFIPKLNTEHDGYAWVSFGHWPKPLHQGLRKTIQNKMNQMKLDTVFKMLKLMQ